MSASVLIVEDDLATRTAVSMLLEVEGHAAAAVDNGRQALEYLRSAGSLPRFILLDLMMPVMDGWQFLAERHKDPTLLDVPVVIFTASGGGIEPNLRTLGANEVLHKPADPSELLAVVGRYC